ncbi:hypothetical protein EIN_087390 [Entamoeba invadens IP1]|uniref:hypothetical protein n=1 Tax=Entamoeba invadens IP1 TaxID=370355 RepID=UPI0002C3FBF7|nr:hypothetical protein EIN_087390 [Entamoeba invadens IP1]ELP85427.1 hypothetical protein EIN_087390 [Entamoeba invadens IP1]|eukprot:XP_004184773.1 hypothetical protein EIN_087390 [Entamoeba invadens IP1]
MLEKETVKRLKDLGILTEKGEYTKKVEEVGVVQRLWDAEKGNECLVLPKETIYELLSAYCMPFLLYKQTILVNRDLLMKHTSTVATKLETINSRLPKSVDTMKKLQLDMPRQIQTTLSVIKDLKARVQKVEQNLDHLTEFNKKLVQLLKDEENISLTQSQPVSTSLL